MLVLKLLNDPYLLLTFLVPGLVMLFVRAQFLAGRRTLGLLEILPYLAVSIIYYALVYAVVSLFGNFADLIAWMSQPGFGTVFWWLVMVFVVPTVFGLLLGLNIQKDFIRNFLRRRGFNAIHAIPTAWDWKFSDLPPSQWILVTLKDGKRFGGLCGPGSFISSEPSERDIYIDQIFDIDSEDKWHDRKSGVLLTAGEVQSIEFL